jgi:ClpP class serine protease
MAKRVRQLKAGELLAINPTSLHSGPSGMFWLAQGGPKPNEVLDGVTLVFCRGELEHHASMEEPCESYEGLIERLTVAYSGDVSPEGIITPPTTIIVCFDSPGGVVAGLNECHFAIQRLSAANPDVNLVAWIDEMACSACYALACACQEIVCPPSAILGSIGVVSTMASQSRKNAAEGFDVRLITSGARKADGHMHVPISDDAVRAETDRVNKLAAAFYDLVSTSRDLPPKKIQALEAGVFLGTDAVKKGLADAIMTFDDLLLGASRAKPSSESSPANVSIASPNTEASMPIALSALIKKTEAKVVTEKDPKKLSSLLASLEAYKKTEKMIEHTKSEEGDDGDDDCDDGDDKAAAPPPPPPAKDDDKDDDKAKASDDEDEATAVKALISLISKETGMKGAKALGALKSIFASSASTAKDVAELKAQSLKDKKAQLIQGAKGKFVTSSEAAWLAEQPLATVEGFVEMRTKSGVIVNVDESTLVKPKASTPGTESALDTDTIRFIDDAVRTAAPADPKAFRAALVEAHLSAHKTRLDSASNGIGRY